MQLYTPLHTACASGQVEVVRVLLERGARRDDVTAHGNNCVHIACLNGQDMVLGELLQGGDTARGLVSAANHKGMVSGILLGIFV